MKKTYDLSDFVFTLTESQITKNLVERFRKRRKELKISQKELSVKSGVSYSSIRRFEETCEISLSSLVKLANAIDCLNDFEALFKDMKISSLKEL